MGELFIDYLERHGQPDEYDFEELQEKYLLLDWLACQLCFQRPTRAKQLCIYGVPNTQRTLLFHLLSPVLRIHFTSSPGDDLNVANKNYDLCVFEEYQEQYSRIFHKKGNPPIVMISNNLPASTNGRDQRPFRARYIRIRFSSKIHDLDEARIIATLRGCITRRVCYSPSAFFSFDVRQSERPFA